MNDAAHVTRHLIETYAAAWLSGDTATVFACYHDDFTLHYYGHNALSGEHIGKPQAIAALRELARRTRWRVVQIKSILTGPDSAALHARIHYLADSSTPLERDRVLIFAIADGLLRDCWAYDQDQALLDQLIGTA